MKHKKDETQKLLDKKAILFTDIGQVLGNIFLSNWCQTYLNNKIATGFESCFYTGMTLIALQKALIL